MHPLVVICHNNHTYVRNTLAQAHKFGLMPIVIDNASSYEATCAYLKSDIGAEVIYLSENVGHLCWKLPQIYDAMPGRFFLTDPDLQWSPRLPADFSVVLDQLCSELNTGGIGFALDISDSADMFQDADYHQGQSIAAWESQFWVRPVTRPPYELYAAPIDTTFLLVNKANINGPHIRVAGEFTAKHLPWYRNSRLPPHEAVHMYAGSKGSTIARLILREMTRKNVRWDPCEGCRHLLPSL